MNRHTTCLVAALALAVSASGRADAPRIYAIKDARLVTASGATLQNGTIVLRDGLIDAVGANVTVPGEARVIEGSGLTVYPGLIDLHNTDATDIPDQEPPRNLKTTEELERWKRGVILRPQLEAVEYVKVDSHDLGRLASAGITSVLAVPEGQVVKGRSALVNVVAPDEDPQIGAVADPRRGLTVLRAPVALHVEFTPSPRPREAYPGSLMGTIAFVRQAFLDAQHHQAAVDRYGRAHGTGIARPVHDTALDAMQPALSGRMPVAFEANEAREVLRALDMAAAFKLDALITGGLEADLVAADLKARNARVVYSLNFPSRPRNLAPESDEPVRVLRRRADAAKKPAALEQAGVLFAYGSDGLKEPRDFVKNAAKTVRDGLPAEAALRALTLNAARIAGVADRLGSLEKGKIANLIVTEGDLFDEKMKIRHVFVDGREVPIAERAPDRPQQRRAQD
jgi:imidazolonepropionase-like amidohydrolase